MGCKELWIGCHVSCKKKGINYEKRPGFTTNFCDILVGEGGGERG
jgi:hypothetical protein